jgi:hypothetical protein
VNKENKVILVLEEEKGAKTFIIEEKYSLVAYRNVRLSTQECSRLDG